MAASPSWWAAAPSCGSIASTPSSATSSVTSRSSAPPSGPTSSNDFGRTTPPATTTFIRERTSSSLAMFSALVTTVSWAPSALVLRSGRTASARATSVLVVPPLRPTTVPGDTSAAAAAPIRCFSAECFAVL